MTDLLEARAALRDCKRVVIKIGSRALVSAGADSRVGYRRMAAVIANARERGVQGVLVSSGAVAEGRKRLGWDARPKRIERLQAAAATGQALLMRAYDEEFHRHGLAVAQLLLTHDDLSDRNRYLNARAALDELLALGVVPIINENDTVATEELRFGDNDTLASMVSTLVGADLLVILTSVPGVLNNEGERISHVGSMAEVDAFLKASPDDLGLGGMRSKLESAFEAAAHGVPVVIGDASDELLLTRVLNGDDVGTLILPHQSPLASRKHWIAYTLKPKGRVVIDAGAVRAITRDCASLLSAGVVAVEGAFEAGDAVSIWADSGAEIARGLVTCSSREAHRRMGRSTLAITDELRAGGASDGAVQELIRREDLVVLASYVQRGSPIDA